MTLSLPHRKPIIRSQIPYPSQQKLHMPESRSRLVLGYFVPAQLHTTKRQPPLCSRDSHHSRACRHSTRRIANRYRKCIVRRTAEPLLPTPSHILYGKQSPCLQQIEVQIAMGDDGPLAALDDARQDCDRGILVRNSGLVDAVDEGG